MGGTVGAMAMMVVAVVFVMAMLLTLVVTDAIITSMCPSQPVIAFLLLAS